MDLKSKLKTFMNEIRDSKNDDIDFLPSLTDSPAVAKFKEHLGVNLYDPLQERDTLDSIEDVYYEDQNITFDSSLYELKKLPNDLERREIDTYRKKLLSQLQVVSKKVSEMVLDNHPAYVQELKRVMFLQNQLQTANLICRESRRSLKITKEIFTNESLKLLSNHCKRIQLRNLLQSLYTVKTLQRSDARLKVLLEQESYSKAIELSLECQRTTFSFRQFTCISELNNKLQDTLELIEETLSSAISRHCYCFDSEHYLKVISGYQLLNKYQACIDNLLIHFSSAIHNKAFSIVSGFVQLCTNNDNYLKCPYADLPQHLPSDLFTPCLLDLCKSLWQIIFNYKLTMKWHQEQYNYNVHVEMNDLEYMKQKLLHGLKRIWTDAQIKVKTFILSSNLSIFEYEEFIKVIAIVNRLIQIGKEFCESDSQQLLDCIHEQSVRYFESYHKKKMEELEMFCDHEAWQIWPVHSNFNILYLSEFKFMRNSPNPSSSKDFSEYFKGRQKDFFATNAENNASFQEGWTPFDSSDVVDEQEDFMEDKMKVSQNIDSDSDSDVCEELKKDFIDEEDINSPKRSTSFMKLSAKDLDCLKNRPIITNTSLNILRIFGRYIQMMNVLDSVSMNVITSLSHLYDFYLYKVYQFFIGSPTNNSSISHSPIFLSNKMACTLQRIADHHIISDNIRCNGDNELNNCSPLQTLPLRVAAIESLIFLADTLQFLKPEFESFIPKDKLAFLQQFFSQTVVITDELRYPIYRAISLAAINFIDLKEKMSSINWSINELKSQHSSYVDSVIKDFENLNKQLDKISSHTFLNDEVLFVIYDQCIMETNHCFVEGFSSTKKCTSEGRALMLLDYQQFLINVERITKLKPVSGVSYVEAYIKAYYLPEELLIEWFNTDKGYTKKQLTNLILLIPHLTKKVKNSLITMISEHNAE